MGKLPKRSTEPDRVIAIDHFRPLLQYPAADLLSELAPRVVQQFEAEDCSVIIHEMADPFADTASTAKQAHRGGDS